MTEGGRLSAREALTMALFWAAAVVYFVAVGVLAFLGADLIWWVASLLAVIGVLALGRLIAPSAFTEAQARKQPDRRTLPRLFAVSLYMMVVAGVAAFLGANRG